ncbi:MAG: glycosyl transferase, partial [Pseudomonadota bacterium]
TADPNALAACLTQALTAPPQMLEAMAARARNHARSKFALHHMQRETLAVYDELLGTALAAKLT